MARRWARLSACFTTLVLSALLCGCDLPHQDVATQGNADGVVINYYGDVAATLPLARQHCARYERVPLLHQAKDNHAVYFCIKSGAF